jgi:hypothetical protein
MPEKETPNWFNNPFPFMDSNKEKLLSSFAFAVFVYLFLLIFQPFGINQVKMNIPVYLLGFFFITLGVMLISNMLLPAIFKNAFDPDRWDVKKSILFNTFLIAAIGILNWVYNHSIERSLTIDHSLGYFMLITLGVGIIPSGFLVLIAENYLRKKNHENAIKMEGGIKTVIKEVAERRIKIDSDNENEYLEVYPSQLICIKSEANYAQFFYEEGDQLRSKLLRISMNKLEEKLKKHKQFKRCHRSYISNFNKINHLSGNARNYNLHYHLLEFTVPISRSFPKEEIILAKNE